MVISPLALEFLSSAETKMIFSEFNSKVTSIYGTPLGALGIPFKSNVPNK